MVVPPEICPNCGAEVPPKARHCPECGSDEETGWSEEAQAADLGLPEEQFDYEEFVKKEFGGKKSGSGLKWYWVVAALLLIVILIKVYFPW
jgi:uncharacterized membrane protein YvbJ